MSKSTITIIPFDIIENIVEILDEAKDHQVLKAIALTCRSLLHLCRKHIFYSIIQVRMENVGWTDRKSPLPSFLAFEQLLWETPVIGQYVCELQLDITQESHSWPPYSLEQAPRYLTKLSSLTVSFSCFIPTHSRDWNNFPSSIQRLLLKLMNLPTLHRLHLWDMENFPISNLIPGPYLIDLSIDDLDITTEHGEAASSPLQEPMQLEVLDIEVSSSQMLKLLAARCPDGRHLLDLTGLETIHIRFDLDFDWREGASPTRDIFRQTQRVTVMTIVVEVGELNFQVIELARTIAPSLQTLTSLHFSIHNIIGLDNDPLGGLCYELEKISGKNNLEFIDIQVYVELDEDCHIGAQWGMLENVLLNSRWPMLKVVSLSIFLFYTSASVRRLQSPFAMVLKSLPQTQFTRLTLSKHLDFKFSVAEQLENNGPTSIYLPTG